jgi:hypothetical protein
LLAVAFLVDHVAQPRDGGTVGLTSRTVRSMVCASADAGSAVRSTTFMVEGARPSGDGATAICSTSKSSSVPAVHDREDGGVRTDTQGEGHNDNRRKHRIATERPDPVSRVAGEIVKPRHSSLVAERVHRLGVPSGCDRRRTRGGCNPAAWTVIALNPIPESGDVATPGPRAGRPNRASKPAE